MKKKWVTEGERKDKNTNSERLNIKNLQILRGETQKNVNYNVLRYITDTFKKDDPLNVLDLPCGSMIFLRYMRMFFTTAVLLGADIKSSPFQSGIQSVEMDLTKEFTIPEDEKFDLITSISGVMMFSNTLNFISNCAQRLKENGTFIITNDNSSTIIDKLAFLFLGRYRIFKPIYEDSEELTQNISIQELCRLLRTNGLVIEKIKYTSFYLKDLIYFPLTILIFPLQWIYIRRCKTKLSYDLIKQMFSFRHYFCKHYIIIARKG